MNNSDSLKMLKTAVEAMNDKKAYGIKVLDISQVSLLADYFLIADGTNHNQVQAIADNIEEQMLKNGYSNPKIEGYNSASWILMDYSDIIIHVFDHESRSYYDLERIWRDAKEINIENI